VAIQKLTCAPATLASQIQLARRAVVCLTKGILVQLGPKQSSLSRISQSALGSLLALLLLIATTASVSHALHQSLHQDGSANSHICLACSFAKGQLSVTATTLLGAVVLFSCLWGIRRITASPSTGFEYRFSLSRAPPLP
jgi:hypothetical protein